MSSEVSRRVEEGRVVNISVFIDNIVNGGTRDQLQQNLASLQRSVREHEAWIRDITTSQGQGKDTPAHIIDKVTATLAEQRSKIKALQAKLQEK